LSAIYDFVIIGAGAAGSVLAKRLSENRNVTVALLEAGGPDSDIAQMVPAFFSANFRSPFDWNYYSVPQRNVNNRKVYQPRGKMLGGTTSMNAMVYNRGFREDYDGWAAQGNSGWSWNDVVPFFKRSENNGNGLLDASLHGFNGEWKINDLPYVHESTRLIQASHAAAGIGIDNDFSDGSNTGTKINQVFIDEGARNSPANAFLTDDVLNRPNFDLHLNATVHKILFRGRRAYGVQFRNVTDGTITAVGARHAVILSAGVYGSPQILLNSGIGPENDLERLRIEVVNDLPGVGANLNDHAMIGVTVAVNGTDSLDDETVPPALYVNLGQWLTTRTGPLCSNVPELIGFIKTSYSTDLPDLQTIYAPATFARDGLITAFDLNVTKAITLGVVNIATRSRGTVKLASRDPEVAPLIDPAYFTDPRDLSRLVEGIKKVREILSKAPVANVITQELLPGPNVQTDAQIAEYVKNYLLSGYHVVGTCKMGRASDRMAVVDDKLKVHRMPNLYVADASVMPTNVRANPTSTVVMIGEKLAANLIDEFNLDCRRGPRQGLCSGN
jgi:choline dehydrogenase